MEEFNDNPKIHEILLGILGEFHRICTENGLTYYLAYGTLIGAVRHNGFIPWDDDADVWMPRKDYQKLRKILSNEKSSRFRFAENQNIGEQSGALQGKFCDTFYTCERELHNKTHIVNPWVDVFVLDEYSSKEERSFLLLIKIRKRIYNIIRFRHNEGYKQQRNFKVSIYRCLCKLNDVFHFLNGISDNMNVQGFLKVLKKYYYNKNNDNYFTYASCYLNDIHKCTYNINWFGNPKLICFEDKRLYIPCDYDAILTRLYGDYMMLPPEDQRVLKHQITNIKKV